MISIRCLEDCNADILVESENQPIECWNCHRVWKPTEGAFIPVTDAVGNLFEPVASTREEVPLGDIIPSPIGVIKPG